MKRIEIISCIAFSNVLIWIFLSSSSCYSIRPIKELGGEHERHPVYARSLFEESLRDPYIRDRPRISHAYVSHIDTFTITLIDMNENACFIDPKDILVVSNVHDSIAPIIPEASINTAYYSSGMVFDYYGTKYQVISCSANGGFIDIRRLKPNSNFIPAITVTDEVSSKLMVTELESIASYNLWELIQRKKPKYALIDFWTPNCPPCFEKIPELIFLNNSGVEIINLHYANAQELYLVVEQIRRFKIPGSHFRSSPELVKYFSQNGFPYLVLIDVEENSIICSTHRILDVKKHLER